MKKEQKGSQTPQQQHAKKLLEEMVALGGCYQLATADEKIKQSETACIPAYQGNKRSCVEKIGGRLQKWLKDEEKTTLYDAFAGGGGYGLFIANNFAPMVKRVVINEINREQAAKIEFMAKRGNELPELLNEKATHSLKAVLALLRDVDGGGSVVVAQIKHLLAGTKPNKATRPKNAEIAIKLKSHFEQLTETDKFVLRILKDVGFKKRGSEKTVDDIIADAIIDARHFSTAYWRFVTREQGNRVEFTSCDAFEQGVFYRNAIIVLDPPYLFSDSYDGAAGYRKADFWKKAFFEKTRWLVEENKAMNNTVLYHNSIPALTGIKAGEMYGVFSGDEDIQGLWRTFDDFLPYFRRDENLTPDDFVGIVYGRN